ncbi:MAG: hypothetical protein CMO01_29275 [Thalassobius sp.]|nr:hypothetical protein [Thalassovita sp.]
MKYLLITLFSIILISELTAQTSTFAPLNQDYYHWIDRYELKQKQFSSTFYSSVKPYTRKAIAGFVDSLYQKGIALSEQDRFNLQYLSNDNWEWSSSQNNESKKPIFGKFYKVKSDLYHVKEKDFDLHLNPVLGFRVGTDNIVENTLFTNTRGVAIRGVIADKLSFYTFLTDNQIRFPYYVQEEIAKMDAIPGEGFWKDFNGDATDFFTARGYIQVPIIKNYISAQFGHDRNFIGNGYRSLILSDNANNYLFLKLQTKIWKFQYTNLFAKMTTEIKPTGGQGKPVSNKYLAFHHLSLNLSKNFNLGLFESIMFGVPDSLGNGYDLDYLNPIIFYRSIEHDTGDYGNAILGLDFKWNALKGVQLYGQAVLDELIVSELLSGDGWWANKQAAQLGAKYIDVAGISNLDLQLEWNLVRPYTYTHYNEEMYSNYQHYSQALAHPSGANFRELVAILRYQPIGRLYLTAKGIFTKTGYDGEDENWGSNIFLDYNSRQMEYGVKTGQGIATNITFLDFMASYQFRHNIFFDLKQTIRKVTSDSEVFEMDNSITSLTFRWNLPQRLMEF